MRLKVYIAACLLALWTSGLGAQTAGNADVQSVIAAQIEAFQAQDEALAFSFASPTIQRLFGSPENFGAMVRGGYPMVWNPSGVTFLDQIEQGGALWQRLEIIDQAGGAHWFAYEMVQIDGIWRINGVYRIEPPVLGA